MELGYRFEVVRERNNSLVKVGFRRLCKKAKIKACAIFEELSVLSVRVCVQGVSRNFFGNRV